MWSAAGPRVEWSCNDLRGAARAPTIGGIPETALISAAAAVTAEVADGWMAV